MTSITRNQIEEVLQNLENTFCGCNCLCNFSNEHKHFTQRRCDHCDENATRIVFIGNVLEAIILADPLPPPLPNGERYVVKLLDMWGGKFPFTKDLASIASEIEYEEKPKLNTTIIGGDVVETNLSIEVAKPSPALELLLFIKSLNP